MLTEVTLLLEKAWENTSHMDCEFCHCLVKVRVAALEGSDEVSAMPRNTKLHGQSPSKSQDEAISVFKCLSDFSLNYIIDLHVNLKKKKKYIYIYILTERMHLNSCLAYIFGNHTAYVSLNLDSNFIRVWIQSPFQGLTQNKLSGLQIAC